MYKKRGGFTLTEILIVVGIVSFLAVVSLVYLRSQIYKARDAKRKADMHLIQNAVEEYEKDHDCYPPANLVVCKPEGDGLKPYLSKIPCDPISGESYPYEPGGPASCFNWYRMYALLDTGEFTVVGPGGANYDYYVSSPNAPTPVPAVAATPTPDSTPTPTPDSTPTPTPEGGGPYWGCFNGSCNPISEPYCSPKFEVSGCYGACTDEFGNPINNCE